MAAAAGIHRAGAGIHRARAGIQRAPAGIQGAAARIQSAGVGIHRAAAAIQRAGVEKIQRYKKGAMLYLKEKPYAPKTSLHATSFMRPYAALMRIHASLMRPLCRSGFCLCGFTRVLRRAGNCFMQLYAPFF